MIHKIPTTQTALKGDKIKPGDTVILSGIYPVGQYCEDLVDVTITNEGPVFLKSGLKFKNCQNIRLVGNEKDQFKISEPKAGASGISIYGRSSDFEIAYLLLSEIAFAGIMCKDDGILRGQFTMRNIHIHDNVIELTGGEGIYIGQTKPEGHDLENVHVHHNVIRKTGWDGMQFANVVWRLSVHDNEITETGLNIKRKEDEVQDNGIQIGERTSGEVFKNIIRKTRGQGIICFGSGVIFTLNEIYDAGESGFYIDDRVNTTEGFKLIENLVVRPKVHCIAIHANKGLLNEVISNMLLNPGSLKMLQGTLRSPFIEKDDAVIVKELNNYMEDEGTWFRNMKLSDYFLNR